VPVDRSAAGCGEEDEDAVGGAEAGWCRPTLWRIVSPSSGRGWAGALYDTSYLAIIALEGKP